MTCDQRLIKICHHSYCCDYRSTIRNWRRIKI